jgi:CubicO group peptidase (beta-lactamase class C family)
VEYDPPSADLPDGPGTFFWEGAAGTWFWIDPANDVVFVGMIQRMATDPGAPILDSLSRPVVYQALTNPKL